MIDANPVEIASPEVSRVSDHLSHRDEDLQVVIWRWGEWCLKQSKHENYALLSRGFEKYVTTTTSEDISHVTGVNEKYYHQSFNNLTLSLLLQNFSFIGDCHSKLFHKVQFVPEVPDETRWPTSECLLTETRHNWTQKKHHKRNCAAFCQPHFNWATPYTYSYVHS